MKKEEQLTIPEAEIVLLVNLAMEAVACAQEGRLVDGDTLLLLGKRRAEILSRCGASWGRELARRYREASTHYASWYGVPLE